jgi:hypothetical protein
MVDKFFDALSAKNLVEKTKYILMFGNVGNNIYKAKKGYKSVILNELKNQGFTSHYDKENKVTVIYYQSYFAGVLQ